MNADPLYTPLPSARSFRLLKILKDQEHDEQGDDIVRYTLDIFSLDKNCPEYVALSYTWGSPVNDPEVERQYGDDQSKEVLISHSGRPARRQLVGRNLFDAITHVSKTEWRSYIWADAICINQEDLGERSSQVRLMGEIFSGPVFVLAWLGPEPPNVDDIIWWYTSFIDYLVQYLENNPVDEDSSLELKLPHVTMSRDSESKELVMLLDDSKMTVTRGRMLAFYNWFMNTRFFSRLWILQELSLPKRVKYLLGPHDLSIDPGEEPLDLHTMIYLWLTVNMVSIRELVGQNPGSDSILPLPRSPTTHSAWRARELIIHFGELADHYQKYRSRIFGATDDRSDAFALLELFLARSSHLHARDDLDKIYSLLGMIARRFPDTDIVTSVDYTLTAVELLKAITIKLLTELPYMTCFSIRPPACYRRLQGLPSWAIDPTTDATGLQPGGLSTIRKTPHNACPTRNEENATLKFQGDTLHLYGHYCGEIPTFIEGFSVDPVAPGYKPGDINLPLRTGKFIKGCLKIAIEDGPNYRWDSDVAISEALVQTMTLTKDAEDELVIPVESTAFWILAKRSLGRMLELAQGDDKVAAEACRSCLRDCVSLVIKLSEAGTPMLPSLVAYARRLATEDVDLRKIEDLDLWHAETQILRPLIQNTGFDYRVFFRSEHGFLGLAAEDARPGDQLWILCRSRTPHILRPLPDGTFVALGEAYVNGALDGELIEQGIAGPLRKIAIV